MQCMFDTIVAAGAQIVCMSLRYCLMLPHSPSVQHVLSVAHLLIGRHHVGRHGTGADAMHGT